MTEVTAGTQFVKAPTPVCGLQGNLGILGWVENPTGMVVVRREEQLTVTFTAAFPFHFALFLLKP